MKAANQQISRHTPQQNAKRLQRLYADRQPLWQKLETILNKIDQKGHSGLTRSELQELGGLYRCVAADLARVRALAGAGGLDMQIYLNNLAVRAHNQIYLDDSGSWQKTWRFLWYGFPTLVRKYFLYVFASFMLVMLPLLVGYNCVQTNPNFGDLEVMPGRTLLPDEMRDLIESHRLWTADKKHMSPIISSLIITNNIRVSILAFVLGITFAIGTILVLAINGLFLGTVFGACRMHGMAHQLLAFVVGHGFLELSAIFICGGAGLLMGKALLFPGNLRRIDSLKLVSKDAFALAAGSIPLLLIAGGIEGFVSNQETVPDSLKLTIGVLSFFTLLLYMLNGLKLVNSPLSNKSK